MRPIVSNLIRNQRFQDIAALGRGLYRVKDGLRDPFKQSLYEFIPKNPNDTINQDPQHSQPIKQKVVPQSLTKQSDQQNPQMATQQQETHVFKQVIKDDVNKIKDQSKSGEQVKNAHEIDGSPEVKSQLEDIQQKKRFNENKVPETPFTRALQFSFIGAKIAGSTLKGVLGGQSWKEAAVNESNAEFLAKGLCKMRGAPLKLAQALSIQEDKLIPEPIRKAFEQARQTADIMPQQQLNKILIQEFGTDWMSKFDSFDTQPFAAASIGQVHKGVIEGVEVAVKIQYPGVRESIDSDMNNLRRLMKYTNLLPKTMYMDEILDNTRTELYEECDYKVEAQKQERYRLMLKNDQKNYLVPRVHAAFSTERILTTDYVDGEDLDYVAKHSSQKVRNELGRKIISLTLHELFHYSFMQSDPNPSNFSYKKSTDQLVLLDFGAAREYSKQFTDLYIDIIYGAAHRDRAMCLKKSEEIGFLSGQESLRMRDAHVDSIMIVGEPFIREGEYDFGSQKMTEQIYQLMPIMLKYRLKSPPPEVYSLHRKLSGSYLMNMKLNSRVDCRSIFMKLYKQYSRN